MWQSIVTHTYRIRMGQMKSCQLPGSPRPYTWKHLHKTNELVQRLVGEGIQTFRTTRTINHAPCHLRKHARRLKGGGRLGSNSIGRRRQHQRHWTRQLSTELLNKAAPEDCGIIPCDQLLGNDP
ncbi:MAG: hypothetical protein ACJARS_003465 [bacterium]|jgi:hypothetical protein